ncbi:uncharacterized protein N7482_009902 [Penicillium canariense]|uniref:Uncharacterized protein n=1 Tax=Penicillium canariense TaxID=189055 RepID=A0A9W9HR98_9EURO|nr:uncharacterized protein N7482_009902 [Penicillium canariense]KAJ5153424.1 hypothetical protein N7482_009902 [Penicillium canariense]
MSESGFSSYGIDVTSSAHSLTVIETTFDMTLQIMHGCDEPTTVAMTTCEYPPSTSSKWPEERLRYYRIDAGVGSGFISEIKDCALDHGEGGLDSVDILSSFPPRVLENYLIWMETWSENWQENHDQTGDYWGSIFRTAEEEVAWNVTGYLLAWRIAMCPEAGVVEYSTRQSQYLLEPGAELSVTIQFLKEQLHVLEMGNGS